LADSPFGRTEPRGSSIIRDVSSWASSAVFSHFVEESSPGLFFVSWCQHRAVAGGNRLFDDCPRWTTGNNNEPQVGNLRGVRDLAGEVTGQGKSSIWRGPSSPFSLDNRAGKPSANCPRCSASNGPTLSRLYCPDSTVPTLLTKSQHAPANSHFACLARQIRTRLALKEPPGHPAPSLTAASASIKKQEKKKQSLTRFPLRFPLEQNELLGQSEAVNILLFVLSAGGQPSATASTMETCSLVIPNKVALRV
jgi:hypothetical protein